MLNKNGIVAAIDLGSSKIVTIVGKKDKAGNLEIHTISKTDSKSIKRGHIQSFEETSDAVRFTINDVQKQTGYEISEVLVGVSGVNISSSKNRGFKNLDSYDHEIEIKDVDGLLKDMHKIHLDADQEIIEIFPQNYTVDDVNGIKNPIGMCCKRLEGNFYIITGVSDSTNSVIKCMKQVGLKVNKITLEPLASAEAVLSKNEKKTGVILVDIGAETTNLIIYVNGVVKYIEMIPFGGNHITKDIKEQLFIEWSEAEKIKINYGISQVDLESDPKNQVTSLIQARVEEILNCLTFEIEKSGIKDKLHSGMVITGGGALLKNLPQFIKFRLGMNVRVGYPEGIFNKNEEYPICHPMFSSSIGLIIKAFEYNNYS